MQTDQLKQRERHPEKPYLFTDDLIIIALMNSLLMILIIGMMYPDCYS